MSYVVLDNFLVVYLFSHVASVFDLPLVKSRAHKYVALFRYLLLPFAIRSSSSPWRESLLFHPYTNLLFFSLVRICLEANMVGSNTIRSSDIPSVEFSSLPRCGCDRAMKMWVANTVQNRNGSSRDVNENNCDLFVWDDEIEHCMNANTNILASCKNCEITKVKLEITTKKLEKAKMEIDVQKKKYFNLKMGLVISWFMFAMLYKIM
ncbi:hypothetical protein KIW84_073963 [Lathyrus oleraceus]|uniref:Uncharacterized protein n=1 Tax=Pisum sativum TaxID=3888 RepID=A0A9D4ZZB6_PEA|nr:hypothetical protein KIW84_073963 [Pisum sativum]